MCGIIAAISKDKVKDTLISGLEKLEYRGYDSSGIATKENNSFKLTKAIGELEKLKVKLQNQKSTHNGTCGIAHTRWATHGGVTVTNAHPFKSENWCLAHNGIITNYHALKNKYNLQTKSQTDSEVVLQLLEKQKTSGINALIDTCAMLEGSFALAVLNRKENSLFFAKNKSPFFVAKTTNGVIGASDVACFANQAENFFRLEDGEFCLTNLEGIKFFDKNKNELVKSPIKTKNITYSPSKDGFAHFMEKEIFQTKEVINTIFDFYTKTPIETLLPKNLLKGIKRVRFVACGTAYHSAIHGARALQKILGIECTAHVASEFETDLLSKHTLCVFVSQSGETADTLSALKAAREKGCKTVGIVNVPHSTMAASVDVFLPVLAGAEIAVASTKAYFAQILVMLVFAYSFAKKAEKDKFFKDFEHFKDNFQIQTEQATDAIIKHLSGATSCFLLGRGEDVVNAKEAALKIKEVTYINCNAMPSGELKHGSIALIEPKTPVILFCTNPEHITKIQSAKEEVQTRGGKVLLLSQLSLPGAIPLQKFEQIFMPIVAMLPVQLAAYKISTSRGINPDKPRNLAKSVTVD